MTVTTDVTDLCDEAIKQEACNVGDGARVAYLLRWAVNEIERLRERHRLHTDSLSDEVSRMMAIRVEQAKQIERLSVKLARAREYGKNRKKEIERLQAIVDKLLKTADGRGQD